MSPEDAVYYADDLTEAQRAVVMLSSDSKPTLAETIARGSGYEHSDISCAIDQLLAMNLIEQQQSRLAGKFFHNYVTLNERGVQVRSIYDQRGTSK